MKEGKRKKRCQSSWGEGEGGDLSTQKGEEERSIRLKLE